MTRRRLAKGALREMGCLVAFLDMSPSAPGIPGNPSTGRLFRGAHARAAALGLKMEIFAPQQEGIKLSRLRSILTARGVSGMVVGPMPHAHFTLDMDLSGIAVVALAYSLEEPNLHRVSHNHYVATMQALQWLAGQGRRRIGMAIENHLQERVGRRWHAAYMEFCESHHLPRFPAFQFDWDASDWESRKQWFQPACEWVARHRLDAVLGLDPWIMEALTSQGSRGLKDVLYFDMDWYPGKTRNRPPCINQRFEDLGAIAVDQIVGQWARYEYGVPQNPVNILLNGDLIAPKSSKAAQ